jgi:hypothetical protein
MAMVVKERFSQAAMWPQPLRLGNILPGKGVLPIRQRRFSTPAQPTFSRHAKVEIWLDPGTHRPAKGNGLPGQARQ